MHTRQLPNQAGAYPGCCSIKRLGVFLPPPPPLQYEMLVHHRVTPSITFAGTYLYNWVERCEGKMSCPRTQHSVPGHNAQVTSYKHYFTNSYRAQ